MNPFFWFFFFKLAAKTGLSIPGCQQTGEKESYEFETVGDSI